MTFTISDLVGSMRGVGRPGSKPSEYFPALAGSGDGGSRKPPKTAEGNPFFEQPYDGDEEDSMLFDLKGSYNTYKIMYDGIMKFADKNMRDYEKKRAEHLRGKMGDILACIWLLESKHGKHSY